MTKREKFIKDSVNKMFELAEVNLTYDMVKGLKSTWFTENTMTEEQYQQWYDWSVTEIVKRRVVTSKRAAKKEIDWLNFYCGLKIRK